jgi:hypothetical protein
MDLPIHRPLRFLPPALAGPALARSALARLIGSSSPPQWSALTRFTRISCRASPESCRFSPWSPIPSKSTPPGCARLGNWWLVTDPATREAMVRKGLDAGKIIDTGFPVHPVFSHCSPVDAGDSPAPLPDPLFPHRASCPTCRRHARDLLETSPAVRLTIVLGRNVRRLYPRPGKSRTPIPAESASSAGRAASRNCSTSTIWSSARPVEPPCTKPSPPAARCSSTTSCPARKRETSACSNPSAPAPSPILPEKLGRRSFRSPGRQAAGWRTMKHALARHNRNAGAITAARFILRSNFPPQSQTSNHCTMTFLFDIGRVLLDFDFESSLARLLPPDCPDPHERLRPPARPQGRIRAGAIDPDELTSTGRSACSAAMPRRMNSVTPGSAFSHPTSRCGKACANSPPPATA